MCVFRGLIHGLKHDGGLQSIASCPIDTVCCVLCCMQSYHIVCLVDLDIIMSM